MSSAAHHFLSGDPAALSHGGGAERVAKGSARDIAIELSSLAFELALARFGIRQPPFGEPLHLLLHRENASHRPQAILHPLTRNWPNASMKACSRGFTVT